MSKICIIAGHGKSRSGGYDSGAVSKDKKYHEFKIARSIAKYTADSLGCDLMNYDGDMYLTDRIKAVNSAEYDFIAEIHLNAGGGNGTEVYYSRGSDAGARFAQKISSEISKAMNVKNRGAKLKLNSSGKDYFGIIRQTSAQAVLVETVFIDCDDDLNKIKTASGQKKCAEAIAGAIKELSELSELEKELSSMLVKVNCLALTIRSGAGTTNKAVGYLRNGEAVKIEKVDGNWGRLADGRGWISLNEKYVRRI